MEGRKQKKQGIKYTITHAHNRSNEIFKFLVNKTFARFPKQMSEPKFIDYIYIYIYIHIYICVCVCVYVCVCVCGSVSCLSEGKSKRVCE